MRYRASKLHQAASQLQHRGGQKLWDELSGAFGIAHFGLVQDIPRHAERDPDFLRDPCTRQRCDPLRGARPHRGEGILLSDRHLPRDRPPRKSGPRKWDGPSEAPHFQLNVDVTLMSIEDQREAAKAVLLDVADQTSRAVVNCAKTDAKVE